MTDRELMQMALDALQKIYIAPEHDEYIRVWWPACEESIKALRDRLAQPEPEPIAWMVYTEDGQDAYITSNPHDIKNTEKAFPLWAYPKEWVGLTDEEGAEMWADAHDIDGKMWMKPKELFRDIEAKLKEKNA
jgi:hypothetical protein